MHGNLLSSLANFATLPAFIFEGFLLSFEDPGIEAGLAFGDGRRCGGMISRPVEKEPRAAFPADGVGVMGALLSLIGGAVDDDAWPVALADAPRTSGMKSGPDRRLAEPAKAGAFPD